MRRNYIPFIAGMSTMLLLVGLVGASMAEETSQPAVPQSGTLNGQVAYGEAGVALFGKEQVPAGTTWTTEDGAQVPTVLTYTDENGEDHYFVSAETTAEVLDMVYGVVYREDLNCIDFGTEVSVDAEGNPRLDENGQPTYWTGAEFFSRRTTQNEDGTERIVAIGDQQAEIQVGDGTSVIVGHGLEEDSPIRDEVVQRQMETPTKPEYGISCGIFTEVDPAELDPAAYLGRFVDGVALQGEDLTYTFHFNAGAALCRPGDREPGGGGHPGACLPSLDCWSYQPGAVHHRPHPRRRDPDPGLPSRGRGERRPAEQADCGDHCRRRR